jgi:alkylated DNA repair dioxygenase AlkB
MILSEKSWITQRRLPPKLEKYAWSEFDAMMALSPDSSRVVMYNKDVESPRLHRSYLCTPKYENINYSYMFCGINDSNESLLPEVFQPLLDFANVGEATPFNQITVNWYRDGNDFIAYHSDYEDKMATTDVMVISLGATRNFDLKKKGELTTTTVPLTHGDILVMHGDTQKEYRHRVPKDGSSSPRISITLRKYKT